MKILLSNDDGVHAEGLRELGNTMRTVSDDVVVVAPDRNRSGASNSLTLNVPLHITKIDEQCFCVEGTPTDCVHLALTGILKEQPNIVISGINDGANLGDDVLYSGTVAAATEGRFLGLPAIAVSLAVSHMQIAQEKHFSTAARVVENVMQRLIKDPLPGDTILNINVPNIPFDALQGYEVTRLGTRHQAEPTIAQKDPRGRTVYWVGPPGAEHDAGPGSDFHAIAHGRVSITPLRVDLTHYQSFEQLAKWTTGLNERELG